MSTAAPPIPAADLAGRSAEEQSLHSRTLGDMYLRLGEGDRAEMPALRWKDGGRWVEMTHAELASAARRIARGLVALGIEHGDRVAILSNTRPEWTIAGAGTLCAAAAIAPVYHTNSSEECEYVLAHSEARVVFCEDGEQLAKVEHVRERCPHLEHVVMLTGDGPGAMTLAELEAIGDITSEYAVDERVAGIEPEDLATLIYTSGTTGPPKACMLTHGNWTSASHMAEQSIDLDNPPIVVFMFLPLAHSFAQIIQTVTLDVGGTLAYWQRDPQRLLDDMREVRPTHLSSVPRVFEKVFTVASAGIADQPAAKRAVVRWCFATGRRVRERERAGRRVGPLLRARYRVADRLALSKVRDLFGGRLRMAVTGAAPIPFAVLDFFDSAGVLLLEGWGMTETAATGALNRVEATKLGTVGKPMPAFEVRLAEDGELLVRGPTITSGYFHDPERTIEAFDDDWFLTGDLASIDADGYLRITGRKKDIIITSSGKNITPTNIENALKESRWIAEAVVYGDRRSYLVALLTLDPDELPALAERAGVEPDPVAMAGDERVRALIGEVVDATNERFARIEQVKRFAILDHQLTQESGALTPTMKVKRAVVYERYADEIDRLYDGPPQP